MELLVAVVEPVELEVQLDLVDLDLVVQEQQMILQDLVKHMQVVAVVE